MPSEKREKLADIAGRILGHLKRFEEDPAINKPRGGPSGLRPYYCVNVWSGGARVFVKYVSFQHASSLTRDEATAYLKWLDAGNVGSHYWQGRR